MTSFAATLQAQSQPIDSTVKLPPGIEHRWEADRNMFLLRDPKRGVRPLLMAEAVRQSTSPAINPEKPEAVETLKESMTAVLHRPMALTFFQEPNTTSPHAPTPSPPAAKKKSSLKWILIAGAGGGAAAALLMSKSKSDGSSGSSGPSSPGTPTAPAITVGPPTLGGPE